MPLGTKMLIDDHKGCAAVTYRATSADGAELEMRLVLPPARASLFDAWTRFTALHGEIDPTSLEVEVRRGMAHRASVQRTTVLDLARAVMAVVPALAPRQQQI